LLLPRLGNIRAIGNPRIGRVSKTLYLGLKQGGALFNVSSPEKPRELQTYEGNPWFENTALSRRLLSRYDPEKGEIEIFEAIASRIT
jgi:hypothetical protein